MDQAGTLRQMMREQVAVRPRLRVIGLASGKGGVGKTHVVSNLGVLAARQGMRTLLVDGDLGLANVEVLYGLRPEHHIGDLLDGKATLKQVLTPGPCGVTLMPGGTGVQKLTHIDELQRLRLVSALDEVEDDYDVVLVDAGAGLSENVLLFAGSAQQTILIVSPEPTSLTDAYATVKALSVQAGVRRFDVVVNQAPTEAAARNIFDRLSSVTARFLDARVSLLGSIPRDENVHRATMAQRPLVEVFPHSPATRALNQIADRLFRSPPPDHSGGGLKLMWRRLQREAQT